LAYSFKYSFMHGQTQVSTFVDLIIADTDFFKIYLSFFVAL